MIYELTNALYFPPVEQAVDGIVAFGGDLSAERLILAYNSGIFPWYEDGSPIIWWSPPERMVVFPDEFTPSKTMRQILRKNVFQFSFNADFRAVISGCRQIDRRDQDGTWITDEMVDAYCKLHDLGIAKSVEVWQNGELVGGLYGVDLGHVFCGESMFSRVSNASKAGFCVLVEKLRQENYALLDCQVYNDHLQRLGAREIARDRFMQILKGGKVQG